MVNNKKSRSSVSNSRPSVSSRPSKCQKITNIKKDVGEVKEDRISSLADALLSHILSFLGTKEAVKTSALSKRWRYVWTETPVLDFSFATDLNLANFVHKILDMNKVLHLKKYRFFYLLRFDLTHVNAWIANLSERCIDDVELYLGYYIRHDLQVPFELLLGFLNRVQPVILTLAAGPLNEHLTLKDQFRLKILHLTHNSLCVAAVKRLLASCLVLEELRISQCVWDDCLHIVSSTLKYFSIDYSFDNIPAHVVNAPNLQQLYIRFIGENKFGTYFLGSCLMKAKISVLGAPLAVIQAITGTKTLHLWSYWIDEPVQRAINNNELCFNYLTHLKLHLFYCMVRLLPGMLKCSPNLVSLIVSKSKSCVRERDDMARLKVPKCVVSFPPLEVPKCVVLCLENVEIELSSDEDSECEDCIGMVGYFIRNAAVMKEMKLSAYAEDSKKEIRFLKELLMIPRASTFCQVRFINKHQQL